MATKVDDLSESEKNDALDSAPDELEARPVGSDGKKSASATENDDDDDDDDDRPDPALSPGQDDNPDHVVKSTSGLQSIEDRPKPPDLRDEHEHDEHHGLAHTTPVSLLVGILAVLLVLTVITVLVTRVDLGGQGNLVIAMVIATIKAGLVVTYFMHLRWDRKLHLLLFFSSVLFMILFLSMALTDRSEYQPSIDQLEEAQTNAR